RDTRRSAVPGETGSRIVTHPRRSELGRTRRAVVSSKARSGHSPNPVHLSDPVADAVPDRRSRLLDRVDRRSSGYGAGNRATRSPRTDPSHLSLPTGMATVAKLKVSLDG